MSQTDYINCKKCLRILPRGTAPCPVCGKWWPDGPPAWVGILALLVFLALLASGGSA